MIQFKNWQLEWDGAPVAMQFDNDSVRLEIVGEMPAGYDWELLMREPEGGTDILPLEEQPGGVGVLLKRENLPKWGTYALQLRGTLQADGTTQRHSTVAEVLVPESLSGDTAWPEIPAAFRQLEARLKELAAHPPKPGSEGYWRLWDAEEGTYHDSNLPVGTGGPGAEVFYIDLAGNYPDYTCPVALADIKAAYETGKVLECRCMRGKFMAALPLFIPAPELGLWVFSGSGQLTMMQVPAQAFTIAITPNGVLVDMALLATTNDIPVIPDKLPNPYTLTITSGGTTVTYDGSTAESIDIPAGPKGDKGDPGARGEKGDPGPQGPAGAVCNANLLDNWYFGNPVNQRGASGTINTAGYFFDRWKLVSGSVTINSGGIVLNGTIAQVREYAVGQAVTATVLTPDGVTDVTPVYDDEAKTFTVTAQGKTIRAVKLELGTQQTLAHQENGVWVLNEIPDYVEQLRKCQRYLYMQSGSMMVCGVLTGSKKSLTLAIPVPAPMRSLPSLEGIPGVSGVRTIQGTNMAAEITSGAVLASTARDTDIGISLNTETFNTAEYINNTPIVCYISNVMLSAEL